MKRGLIILGFLILGVTINAQIINRNDFKVKATVINSKAVEKFKSADETDILNFNEILSKYGIDSAKIIADGYYNKGLDIQSAKAVGAYLDSIRNAKVMDIDIYQNKKMMAAKDEKK